MPRPSRVIVHVDMDAFYASIEARDNPAYQGVPLVVGGSPDGRGVVAAASYEARRYGIRSAMPSRDAAARCPHAVFLPVDMEKYRRASARLFALLDTFTPQVEAVSIDEAFLDLSGCPPLLDPARRSAPVGNATPPGGADPGDAAWEAGRAIKTRISDTLHLPVSVGVAPNKFLAKVASELAKPNGLRHISAADAIQVLAPLPVTVLWGVGAQTRARLHNLGIHTVGDIQRTPTSVLRAGLGFGAEDLARLSRGVDDRPVEVSRETKSIGRETTFERDTADHGLLFRTLAGLAEDVAHSLRAEGLRGKTVTLKLRYSNFRTLTRSLTLHASTNSGAAVLRAAAGLLDRLGELPMPVRLLGIAVSRLGPAGLAQGLLFGEEDAQDRVDQVRDAINERFGEGTVRPAREIDPAVSFSPLGSGPQGGHQEA